MLKVLWYYKRPKRISMLTGKGGKGKNNNNNTVNVIRKKWRRYTFFLTTIPDEGLSSKRQIIKIFSLNLHISHLDH